MLFERIGKIFFLKMRPSFFFLLLFSPVLAATLFLFMDYSNLQQLQERFNRALCNEKIALAKKLRKERFLTAYGQANPYFLDKQVESISLLGEEKVRLESLCNHPAFPPHPSLKERLKLIEANKLAFIEEDIRSSKNVKETKEKLKNPVQMSEKDLQKVLSVIERVSIGIYSPSIESPQLLITKLHLRNQKTSLQTDTLEVDMNLMKREFTQ